MSEAQKRQFFRVIYPIVERPKVIVAGKSYKIIDLSEGGLKIYVKPQPVSLKVDAIIVGKVFFADGVSQEFTGKILRTHEDFIVVRTSVGISLQRIMNEQRFLIGKYGRLVE